ncbi:MAG TPA: DnaB-like helicase C-terminal domain-containing protein [Microvirga sp.]|jgi:twinkle protein|nr:DnaB-like helicase C-terminal domain-containing protein [Microvirga sp.]
MISDLHQKWLDKRGIDPELAVRFGLYTDSAALVFPYTEAGQEVAAKYRGPNKKFWQRAGGKKTFWNADVLDDPALHTGSLPLVITEGEMDALSAIGSGWPLTVSVPEGAPPVAAERAERQSPEDDASGKYEFVFNNAARLKKVQRFVLAVDADGPGQRLAADLVVRLGASRCAFIDYPEGCKDLNEVLLAHGAEAVDAVLKAARPYPVRGLYQFSDYPPPPPRLSIDTGWATVDKHVSLFPGCFEVVTGIPGHGKTTWVMGRAVNAARNHGWRTVVFSPEMPTVPYFQDKLRRIASGLPLYRLEQDRSRLREVDRFLNDHFIIVGDDPEDEIDEDMTLEWVCERIEDAVRRFGVRHAVLDPWNEVEHAKPHNEPMPDYISRGIRMLKRMAKKLQIHMTVIVHPTKAVSGENPRIPNLYDCEGSAHWFNKPDLGIVVARDPENPMGDRTIIRVAKVRFRETGQRGDIYLRFIEDCEGFEMLDPSYTPYAEAAE